MSLDELRAQSWVILIILLLISCIGIYYKEHHLKYSATQRTPLFKRVFSRRSTELASTHRHDSAHGIILGRKGCKTVYSPTTSESHVLVLGPTGTGKTTATLLPTLLSWIGSSLVIDISGDICRNVNIPRKLIFEPLNPNSLPYNIFALIDRMTDVSLQNEALEQLALLLMPIPEGISSDSSSYFISEGRKLLTGSLIAFYHVNLDFSQICQLILSLPFERLVEKILATKNKKAALFVNSFQGINEKNAAGCKQACDRAITLFGTNDILIQNLRRPASGEACITPYEIATHNVFIVLPDERLRLLSPLTRIIVSQCLNFLSGRDLADETPILLCLDEFASFGRLDMLDALRKLRKRHVRIMVLTQSLLDIDIVYGVKERIAMLTNFRIFAVLGVIDRDTQRYVSDMIGTIQVPHEKSPTGYVEVPAVQPHELSRLHDDLILIHPDGHMRLHKAYYFKHRK